jgi:hypothetical protein
MMCLIMGSQDFDPISGSLGEADVSDIGTCPACSSVALHLPSRRMAGALV